MQYVLLTYNDEKAEASLPPEEMQVLMGEYAAYTQAIQEAGVRQGGEALQPTSAATTVQVREGKTISTHGPFAETKEQLGGFFLIECENLDEALEWAAKCPAALTGSVEVRPVVVYDWEQ